MIQQQEKILKQMSDFMNAEPTPELRDKLGEFSKSQKKRFEEVVTSSLNNNLLKGISFYALRDPDAPTSLYRPTITWLGNNPNYEIPFSFFMRAFPQITNQGQEIDPQLKLGDIYKATKYWVDQNFLHINRCLPIELLRYIFLLSVDRSPESIGSWAAKNNTGSWKTINLVCKSWHTESKYLRLKQLCRTFSPDYPFCKYQGEYEHSIPHKSWKNGHVPFYPCREDASDADCNSINVDYLSDSLKIHIPNRQTSLSLKRIDGPLITYWKEEGHLIFVAESGTLLILHPGNENTASYFSLQKILEKVLGEEVLEISLTFYDRSVVNCLIRTDSNRYKALIRINYHLNSDEKFFLQMIKKVTMPWEYYVKLQNKIIYRYIECSYNDQIVISFEDGSSTMLEIANVKAIYDLGPNHLLINHAHKLILTEWQIFRFNTELKKYEKLPLTTWLSQSEEPQMKKAKAESEVKIRDVLLDENSSVVGLIFAKGEVAYLQRVIDGQLVELDQKREVEEGERLWLHKSNLISVKGNQFFINDVLQEDDILERDYQDYFLQLIYASRSRSFLALNFSEIRESRDIQNLIIIDLDKENPFFDSLAEFNDIDHWALLENYFIIKTETALKVYDLFFLNQRPRYYFYHELTGSYNFITDSDLPYGSTRFPFMRVIDNRTIELKFQEIGKPDTVIYLTPRTLSLAEETNTMEEKRDMVLSHLTDSEENQHAEVGEKRKRTPFKSSGDK